MRQRNESGRRELPWTIGVSCGVLLLSSSAAAQEAPAVGAEEPAPVVDEEAGDAPPAAVEPSADAGAPTREQFETLAAEVAALKQKQEEAEALADAAAAEMDVGLEPFRIYGFMDMGIQRHFTNENSQVNAVFDTNALTFATGNIDVYFDFNPIRDWRALAEIRFTNAPLGQVLNYGGLAGTFERQTTEQLDPNATVPNAPMWGGYTVIERAYIQWSHFQAFNLIVGHFFTPFGIWNVDHGSPTLLTLALPQFIQQKWVPLRQTGVQALGSFFSGEWEYAYRAWISNGRQEENPFDYDDDKAYGARLLVRRDRGGGQNLQLGATYHYGHVRDKVINVTGIAPVTFEYDSTWEYDEHVMGADVSLDVGDTRIRSEGIIRRQIWREGKQLASVDGAVYPDRWQYGGYVTVAHQLPWWGLEPYVYAEIMQQPWEVADAIFMGSLGLNWRFTPATMLKVQATHAHFFDWMFESEGDPTINDITSLNARLVMAF